MAVLHGEEVCFRADTDADRDVAGIVRDPRTLPLGTLNVDNALCRVPEWIRCTTAMVVIMRVCTSFGPTVP